MSLTDELRYEYLDEAVSGSCASEPAKKAGEPADIAEVVALRLLAESVMSSISRWRSGLREQDGAWSGSLLKKPEMLCPSRTTFNADAMAGL